MDPDWSLQQFDQLSRARLYAILRARVAVFVVEQDCPYQDLDGLDERALHLSAWQRDAGLVAYARIVPAGARFAEPSIGRVLTVQAARRTGLGRELMRRAIAAAQSAYSGQNLRISAQLHLERFYCELGFETVSEPYPEDGIAHVEMLRRNRSE